MVLNTWELIRLFGFVAYFYFTASIIFGLLRKTPTVQSQKKFLFQLHQSSAWFGFIVLLAHMLLLIIDRYEPYSLVELMIPFASNYQSFSSGLGSLSFYLFFIIIITSDLWIRKMKFTIWKWLHLAVLPAWFLSLIHGVLIGTDTKSPLLLLFYVITLFIVILAFVRRHLPTKKKHPLNA